MLWRALVRLSADFRYLVCRGVKLSPISSKIISLLVFASLGLRVSVDKSSPVLLFVSSWFVLILIGVAKFADE